MFECIPEQNEQSPTYRKAAVNGYIFSHWLIFITFFNRENLEPATLNIQIWVGVLHNFKFQKCYFLGLVALSPEIQYFKTNRETDINCKLYFVVICRLINIALHGKNYNCHIKSCTFCRPDKVFSREHSNRKLIHWRSVGKAELSTG